MKNIISNFLKWVWVITITAWIIYAADLTLNSGDFITVQKWSDLVTEVTWSTATNATQDINIADLLAEINTLKTKVNTQQTQIDNIVASGGNIVTEISSKTVNNTSRQNWTIGSAENPLTIWKPLIIWADSAAGQNITYMRVTSWVDFWRTSSDSYTYAFANEKSSWATPPSMTLIPTATTVTVRVLAYNGTWNKWTLRAY